MKKQLKSFSIWQSTKVLTLCYFILSAIFFVVLTIVELVRGVGPSALINLITPLVYAVVLLIIYPIIFWIYNFIAGLIGGIEFNIEDK